MKDLENKTILINNDQVLWRNIEGEVVFLNKEDRGLYELNKTASYVWSYADGKSSVKKIIEKVILKYRVSIKEAEDDVIKFISDGVRKKILVLR